MYSRIERVIEIFYNLIVCAVRLNWGCFNRQLDALRDWFNGFVDDIYAAINNAFATLRDWVNKWLEWVDAWTDWAGQQIDSLWDSIAYYFQAAKDYAWRLVSDVYNWAAGIVNDVYDWAASQIDAVYKWATDRINAISEWVWGLLKEVWNYIDRSVKPVLDWLALVDDYIIWLANVGYYQLTRFLADPIGFILGLFKQTLLNWLIIFNETGKLLTAFIYEQLPDFYSFWSAYARTMKLFMLDPVTFIEDTLADTVLDWLAGVMADNW